MLKKTSDAFHVVCVQKVLFTTSKRESRGIYWDICGWQSACDSPQQLAAMNLSHSVMAIVLAKRETNSVSLNGGFCSAKSATHLAPEIARAINQHVESFIDFFFFCYFLSFFLFKFKLTRASQF